MGPISQMSSPTWQMSPYSPGLPNSHNFIFSGHSISPSAWTATPSSSDSFRTSGVWRMELVSLCPRCHCEFSCLPPQHITSFCVWSQAGCYRGCLSPHLSMSPQQGAPRLFVLFFTFHGNFSETALRFLPFPI
jgi:hypothetical protein